MKIFRIIKQCSIFCLLAVGVSPIFSQPQTSGPNTTVPGSQLIFYYDLIAADTGYITIKNTGPAQVFLHIQVLGEDCNELFNFLISLESFCSRTFNLRRFEYNRQGGAADLLGSRGMVLATPTRATLSYAALPYNHLAGSTIIADSKTKTSYGLNAVARLAVDVNGIPLGDSNTPLNGTTGLFQIIRPRMFHLDHFFALNTVTDSRLALVSFVDVYSDLSYTIRVAESEVGFHVLAGTEDCSKLSLPSLSYLCIADIPLRAVLGATMAIFNQSSGSLEVTPTTVLETNQNLFGFFFETLGSYTSARHLWVTP